VPLLPTEELQAEVASPYPKTWQILGEDHTVVVSRAPHDSLHERRPGLLQAGRISCSVRDNPWGLRLASAPDHMTGIGGVVKWKLRVPKSKSLIRWVQINSIY